MSDQRFELSRRNALIGLGTVGAASAGAGLGTSAYFSDEEEFTGNMMTAGELDLAVDYVVHEDQGSAGTYTINSFTNEVNGTDPGDDLTVNGDGTTISQNLSDVKPGDHGHSYFCFTIDDNPAYIWACGELTDTSENGYTEPEPEDDNDEGELEENIEVDVTYCELDDNGEQTSTGDTIFSGTLREVLEQLQAGIPLDGSGDGGAAAGGQAAFAGTSGDAATNPCLCFDWELPTTVGNVIQGDSLEFDLSFHAVQSRHNDGAHNPCADETYTADYVNDDGIAQPIPDGVARVDVSYGDEKVVYGITFDEPDGSQYSLADPNFANANFSMPFDLDNDGTYDYQVAWNAQGGDDFLYSAVESGPNWEKDTSTGWSSVPASITASKSGTQALIAVPRSDLETGGNDYVFGLSASAGGEQPYVGIPVGGPYSSSDNFTSSENGQSATLQ